MRNFIFIVSILIAGSNLFAQNQSFFESEIKTDQKPWTDLNFYNDPDNFQFAIVTDRQGAIARGFLRMR